MSFCSSAFPEMLLLNRKSLSENFRLKMQISRRRPAFKNPAGFLKRTFPIVKERKAYRRRLILRNQRKTPNII